MEKQISLLYPNLKDCYWITDQGEIYNKNTGNILKKKVERDGYVRVSMMKKEGGTTYLQLHRILMMAFKPVSNMQKLQVNHIDGNKQNNNLSNLEWVSPQENIHHAIKTGLTNFNNISGNNSNLANYTEEDAKRVIELLKTNKYTDKEISYITGYPTRSFIAKIRRKETWKYLTKDIQTPLGKAERKTFNNKIK